MFIFKGEIVTQNIAKGVANLSITNFYRGVKPSLIAFMMVDNAAFAGDRALNPFEFKMNGLRTFNFIVNGSAKPTNPYEMWVDKDHNCYSHVFSKVYESLGYNDSERSSLITYENFKSTHFMIVDDLTSFNVGLTDINEVNAEITLGVNGTFASALTNGITCILYMLLPSRFDVSANRAITLIL